MPALQGPPSLPVKPAPPKKPQTVVDPFGVPNVNTTPGPKTGQQAMTVPQAVAAQPAAPAAPVAQAAAANPFDTDPGYLAALAAQQAGSQQADAALRAAQQQAIIQFGDPSLAGLGGFSLDPLTAAMAQQNTQAGLSTVGQLQRQRDTNQQTIQNQLAAHGMIFSGDLGYKTGLNQQDYGTNLYNAQQSVLGQLAGLAQATVAQKQGLTQNVVGAITGAYNNVVSNPALWGAAGLDDGGAKAAANSAATSASPVTKAMNSGKAAGSRLAVKPPPNPFAGRTARQTVGYG